MKAQTALQLVRADATRPRARCLRVLALLVAASTTACGETSQPPTTAANEEPEVFVVPPPSGAAATAASTASTASNAPPASAAPPAGSAVGGSVQNASSVVAGFAAGFRRCYNAALQKDPEALGTVRVTAKIDADGKPTVSKVEQVGTLPQEVGECVGHAIENGHFSPPDGGGATIVIPVSFAPR